MNQTLLVELFTEELPPPVKPRKEQVELDFAMLAGKAHYVRTYRTTDGGEYMPERERGDATP